MHVGPNLVTIAANCRPKVDALFRRGEATLSKRLDPPLHDTCCGASPTGMEQCHRAGRVCKEDGDAIRNRNGESKASIGGDVPVGIIHTEPSLPFQAVHDDTRAMRLGGRGQPHAARGKLVAKLPPSLHDQPSGLFGC
jgi:hypothetical protein